MRVQLAAAAILAALTSLASLPVAVADCGSVPFYAPLMDAVDYVDAGEKSDAKKLTFDPLKVSVFEPKQRALILWNGEEEILLLSTDQRASQKSSVLEVIPLPSEPKVKLGSFKTFEAAQKLVVEKRMWAMAHGGAAAGAAQLPASAGRVTFAKKMGAHDLTVAEVTSPDRFVGFVQDYLGEKYKTPSAPIRPEFVKVIESYIAEGYRWFAFDVIQMDGSLQSREPIEYRFKTDHVHYPLRISSLEKGRTEVDLLVFTAEGATQFTGIQPREMEREPVVGISATELNEISPEWKGFFGERTAVSLDQWRITGESAKLTRDVAAK